jgi:hypothetical protein
VLVVLGTERHIPQASQSTIGEHGGIKCFDAKTGKLLFHFDAADTGLSLTDKDMVWLPGTILVLRGAGILEIKCL